MGMPNQLSLGTVSEPTIARYLCRSLDHPAKFVWQSLRYGLLLFVGLGTVNRYYDASEHELRVTSKLY